MKKLSFLILLCTLLTRAAMAATVSGTLTQTFTSTPAANEMVYIQDTFHTYLDSMLTTSSGTYTFTIPATVPTSGVGRLLNVRFTPSACGVYQDTWLQYNGSSITHNFSICGVPRHYYGGALGNAGGAFANAKFYLIAVTAVNAVTGDTTITAVDSFISSSTSVPIGVFDKYYTDFPIQWVANLRIKAALSPGDPQYNNYLPSYFGPANTSVLQWTNAAPMGYYGEIDLEMIAGTNPGGPGFIGGSVLLGANKSTGVGDPLSKRVLILTKLTGEAVAYTYSDAGGHFSFPSVPLGTYNIFGDALGKSNPALTITLTNTKSSISNIVFDENSKSFMGHVGSLSVGGKSSLDGIAVAPNPVRDVVHVHGLSSIPGEKTIVLLDMTGAEMARRTVAKGEALIPMATLPAGIYLLQVQTPEGTATFRVAK